MVLFNLKKDAGHVRQQMANSLVDICRASFKYDTELNIEGMLCITVDKQDVLPIPVNILLQKTVKQCTSSGLNTSYTQSAAVHSKDRVQVARRNTALDIPSDLQSAQAVLQSILAKTANAQQHPEFMALGDMGNMGDGATRDGGLLHRHTIKLETAVEENDDVEMEEGVQESGGTDEIDDEGIHSQDSHSSKTPTLQDAVGNVIKSFYQETSTLAAPLQQSAGALTAAQASQALSSPLTVIKVIQPNPAATLSPSKANNLTPQQKLANSLPWKRELPKKFQCPMCTYTSDRRFCINRHMKLHVGRAGVQCQICRNIFADHWYLTKVHMPRHHPETVGGGSSSSSNGAGSTSTQATSIAAGGLQSDNHRVGTSAAAGNSLTAKECSIKCPVCPFSASSAISFRNHLNTHSRDCLKCGLRFLTPDDVQQHVHQQHGDDVDFSEYIYDPDMAEHLEDDALQNAVHLAPPADSERASTVVGDKEGVGDAQDGLDMATEGDLNEGLYTEEEAEEQVQVQVPLLMNHNYMMVVNEANQVEILNATDGTVVEGIVGEDGQLYTTHEVEPQLMKKDHGATERDAGHNGEEGDGVIELVSQTQ